MIQFAIIAQARSGSTSLRQLLNTHPEICCHGEVFAINNLQGFERKAPKGHPVYRSTEDLFEMREKDIGFFYNKMVMGERPGVRATGFKIIDNQIEAPRFYGLRHRMRASPTMKLIFLSRDDYLLRYRSEMIKRKRWKADEPSDLDWAAYAGWVTEHVGRWYKLQREFADFPSKNITYEALYQRKTISPAELFDFIGVSPYSVEFESSPPTATDKLFVQDFDELEERSQALTVQLEVMLRTFE